MKRAEQTTLYTGKFLALIKEEHWEYAERTRGSGAVIIVAMTEERKLLLVEQYRIPIHSRTIEMPAGIVGDEPDALAESFVEATRRELLEETGYSAEKVESLTMGPSSAGLSSEMVRIVLASGLKRRHGGGGVGHEKITLHEVPLDKVHDWLLSKQKEGLMIEPKVYTGLYFVLRTGS